MLRATAWMAAFALAAPLVMDVPAARAVDAPPGDETATVEAPSPEDPTSEETAPDSTPTPTPTPTPEVTPTPTVEPTPVPEETLAPDSEDGSDQPDATDDEDARALAPLAESTATVPPAGRIGGPDRYEIAVAASRAAFPSGAATVLISAGSAPPNGITASWTAGTVGAPLLLVEKTRIRANVLTELRRLAPSTIVVYGGNSVGEAVVDQLRTIAPDVRRIGGADLYDLSRTALREAGANEMVYIAEGVDLLAAPLAAGAAAANDRGFLLVPKGRSAADSATIEALRAVGTRTVVVVGGTGGIPTAYESSLRGAGFVVERRVAKDRYALSVLMAKERPLTIKRAIVSNPASWPATAIASALAAAARQPLVYTIQPCVVDGVSAFIRSAGVSVTGVGGDVRLSSAVLRNGSCTAEKSNSQSTLNAAIRSTLAAYPGVYSVTVRQLDGLKAVTSVTGSTVREPASMIKMFAAWAALSRVQAGRASLNTVLPSGVSLGMCIHVMIHASDNYCHTDIVHWIGIAELNRMIRSAGFANTHYGSVPVGVSVLYAGNRTTTNDLSTLVMRLNAGTILSRKYADHLIGEMKNQIGRSRIASGIPRGVVQASKPGALWVASGLLQGDTAIVYGPKSTYVLSIIGDNSPPKAAFQAVSRTVYQHFHGAFGTAASYPAQQLVIVRDTALRSSPGGPMVVVARAGTFVENFETNRIWYEVQYGSRKLWTIVTDLRNR